MMIALKEHSEWISTIKNFLQRNQFQYNYQKNLQKSWNSPNLSKGTIAHQSFMQTLSTTRVTLMKIIFKTIATIMVAVESLQCSELDGQ
jgi:hypothetical protein